MKKRCQTGFTLAELMTVVAILGILAALAMPLFLNAIESSRADTCKSNRRGARNLIDLAEIKSEGFMDQLEKELPADWTTVRDLLIAQNLSPMETLCPSGGLVKLEEKKDGTFWFKCSAHEEAVDDGRTDWLPHEADGTDYLIPVSNAFGSPGDAGYTSQGDDYSYMQAYNSYAKAQNGGALPTVDPEKVLKYFPSDSAQFDNDLVWSAIRVYFDGEHHDILLLTAASNATRENPLLSGYLFYYDGSYYRTKSRNYNNTKITAAFLTGGSGNKSYTFDELLNGKDGATAKWNWEKVS